MRHIEHFLLPHMNTSLDSYLARSHMARNGVWGSDREILSAASLLSTDVFVYTKIGDTYKWQKFSNYTVCLMAKNLEMCGSRKYPYPHHGRHFDLHPLSPQDFPFQGVFDDPPPPLRNFQNFFTYKKESELVM